MRVQSECCSGWNYSSRRPVSFKVFCKIHVIFRRRCSFPVVIVGRLEIGFGMLVRAERVGLQAVSLEVERVALDSHHQRIPLPRPQFFPSALGRISKGCQHHNSAPLVIFASLTLALPLSWSHLHNFPQPWHRLPLSRRMRRRSATTWTSCTSARSLIRDIRTPTTRNRPLSTKSTTKTGRTREYPIPYCDPLQALRAIKHPGLISTTPYPSLFDAFSICTALAASLMIMLM